MYKKILILGANGLIGNGLTIFFSTKKNSLFGVVRSKNKSFQKNIKFLYCGNLNSIKSFYKINNIIKNIKPDLLINCIGVTKHYKNKSNKLINIELPKAILKFKKEYKFQFIHITTDCVFDGSRGDYSENSKTNAKDSYGMSKLKADKILLKSKKCIIIRTSTIGNEINTKNGLLEWFLSNKKSCLGFKNAFFSGLTTLELSKIIHRFIIKEKKLKEGIYNISGPKIDKYSLLNIIKKIYNKEILIEPNYKFKIDRSLNSRKFVKISKYKKKSWKKMILEYKKFNETKFFNKKYIGK